MPTMTPVLPLKALDENLHVDFDVFKQDIEGLNRSEALLLMAKLNCLMGNRLRDDEDLRNDALTILKSRDAIDDRSIRKMYAFERSTRERHAFFARPHFLEMIRWISIWSQESGDSSIFRRGIGTKDSLIRAILTSYEIHSSRLQLPRLKNASDDNLVFESLAVMREMSLSGFSQSNPIAMLGRCVELMDKYFFNVYPDYRKRFVEEAGMTVEEYRDCAFLIFAATTGTDGRPGNLSEHGEFTLDSLIRYTPHSKQIFQRYLELESHTPDSLRASFSGNSKPSDFLRLRALREKPILVLPDGRGCALDLPLLLDRATYGPLFYNIGKGQKKFDDFGSAFEQYCQEVFTRRKRELGCTGNGPFFNEPGIDSNTREIVPACDIAMNDGENFVLIETKGVWIKDEAIELATANEFWVAISKKYGDASEIGGRRKGVAQLAHYIKGIVDDRISCPKIGFPKVFFPILLVHDCHIAIPHFGYYFARDFCREFDVQSPPVRGWFNYKGKRIYSVFVMSIDELEDLERLQPQKRLTVLLKKYSSTDGERYRGIRDYLANEPFPQESWILNAGERVISEMAIRTFGEPIQRKKNRHNQ